jgi:hypothetical protein
MGYIKLRKAGGSVDLIPADNIVYVKGTEGGAETGAGNLDGTAPFVVIVQGFATNDSDKLAANKVIVGPATGDVATTKCAKFMQDAVNTAIIKAASQLEPVEVDFALLLTDANYTGTDTLVTSAAPVLYDVTP